MKDAIHIVLDQTDPQNPVFVEIETDCGRSISIGTRARDSAHGYTRLAITAKDITDAVSSATGKEIK